MTYATADADLHRRRTARRQAGPDRPPAQRARDPPGAAATTGSGSRRSRAGRACRSEAPTATCEAIERELRIPLVERGRAMGRREGRVPAAPAADAARGHGRLPGRARRSRATRTSTTRTSPRPSASSRPPSRTRSASHVERTLRELALRPVDAAFNRHVEDLTRAWAQRRVVRFRYAPAALRRSSDPEPSWREVRPYLLEPSLQTHALYLIGHDETKRCDADVQGGADPRPVA